MRIANALENIVELSCRDITSFPVLDTPHIISIFESAPWFIAASEYAHAVSHR